MKLIPFFATQPPTSFNPTTFDVVWPLDNQAAMEMEWMELIFLNNNQSLQQSRVYDYQLLDSQGNVIIESGGLFHVNEHLISVGPAQATYPLFIQPTSGAFPFFPVPFIIPPKASLRFYDTQSVSGNPDTVELRSSLFTF